MKRYYFWSIFTLLIMGCISFFSPLFVNGQATSDRIEVSGADTQRVVGVEASPPTGWQLHPIILAASRGDAAQNYLLNSQLIRDFFNEVGQSNAVVADVIVQHADLTRRYSFSVNPVSELSAPVPQMQIIVSRADGARHAGLTRPVLLGGDTPTPTASPAPTNEPTRVADTATPTPTATQVSAADTPIPTRKSTPTSLPPGTTAMPPSGGDAYETDDLCSQAKPLPVDGELQERTFHQAGDEDWAQVELQIGNTYEFSAFNTSPKSDLSLGLHPNCEGPPDDNAMTALGEGAEIIFVATAKTAYVRVASQNPNVYGSDVTYTLEVKDLTEDSEDLAIIIVGRDDNDRGQKNIFNAANRAYRTFRNAGILPDQIRYLGLMDSELGDVDDDGTSEIDTLATIENIEDVITNWPRGQVNEGARVYIYMIDHGLENEMLIDGQDNVLTPDALNRWLNILELHTGADVAVIYEACLAGSFIVREQSISKSGRLVITSTQPNTNAYTRPRGGAIFSDRFFSVLDQGKTFYEAYEAGMEAAMLVHPRQIPMLDDNGDYSSDEDDGVLAKEWMLNNDALSGGDATNPVLAELQMTETANDGEVEVRVDASQNEKVERIWVEVYPPSYVEPETVTDGVMPELNLPDFELSDTDNDGGYVGIYEGFVEAGIYRFVAYAEDVYGNMLLPSASTMEKVLDPAQLDGTSESSEKRIYLPLISR